MGAGRAFITVFLNSLLLDAGPRRPASPFLAKTQPFLRRVAPAVFRRCKIAAQMMDAALELALDFREEMVQQFAFGVTGVAQPEPTNTRMPPRKLDRASSGLTNFVFI